MVTISIVNRIDKHWQDILRNITVIIDSIDYSHAVIRVAERDLMIVEELLEYHCFEYEIKEA